MVFPSFFPANTPSPPLLFFSFMVLCVIYFILSLYLFFFFLLCFLFFSRFSLSALIRMGTTKSALLHPFFKYLVFDTIQNQIIWKTNKDKQYKKINGNKKNVGLDCLSCALIVIFALRRSHFFFLFFFCFVLFFSGWPNNGFLWNYSPKESVLRVFPTSSST